MLRAAFSLLSRGGAKGRLNIFIFHRVIDEQDPLFPEEIHARRFDEVCSWISQWFNVLPLDEAVVRCRTGTLPPRAAAITFDDGYEDNHRVAVPILERHGLTATFFIATGFLDGGCMWNDVVIESIRRCEASALDASALGFAAPFRLRDSSERRRAIETIIAAVKYRPLPERNLAVNRLAELAGVSVPRTLMMRSDQVRDMRRRGMVIGAHTVDHPILAGLDRDMIRSQIDGSRQALQRILGEPIELFAYPNGKPGQDYDATAVQTVRELGFTGALSTRRGVVRSSDDLYQLPRFTPWDRTRTRFGIRVATSFFDRPLS